MYEKQLYQRYIVLYPLGMVLRFVIVNQQIIKNETSSEYIL